MDYNLLADFMATNGFWVSTITVCLGLFFFFGVYCFWFYCLADAVNADESRLKDKTLWIVILVASVFFTTFATIIASAVYYSLYIRGK